MIIIKTNQTPLIYEMDLSKVMLEESTWLIWVNICVATASDKRGYQKTIFVAPAFCKAFVMSIHNICYGEIGQIIPGLSPNTPP